jgi:predicted acylesterase/phospholipase RssA
VPISKAIQASTALPGLYTPVEIEGEHYIDGVARRTVHATAALKEGVKLLFCVNPIVPVNIQMKPTSGDKNLTDYGLPVVLSQTLRVMVASRMQTGFERYKSLYPEADTILIEPKLDDFEVFFSNVFSFSNRHHVCEHAYQTTRQFLRDNAESIAPKLAKHGLTLDMEALNTTRKLFDEEKLQSKSALFEMAESTFSKLDDMIGSIRESVGV